MEDLPPELLISISGLDAATVMVYCSQLFRLTACMFFSLRIGSVVAIDPALCNIKAGYDNMSEYGCVLPIVYFIGNMELRILL